MPAVKKCAQSAKPKTAVARKKVTPWRMPKARKSKMSTDAIDCGPLRPSLIDAPLGIFASQVILSTKRKVELAWLQHLWHLALSETNAYAHRAIAHRAISAFNRFCAQRPEAERVQMRDTLTTQTLTGIAIRTPCYTATLLGPDASQEKFAALRGVASADPYQPVVDPPLCPTPRAVFCQPAARDWAGDEHLALFASESTFPIYADSTKPKIKKKK